MKDSAQSKFISANEAAKTLLVCRKTIYNMIGQGRLRAVKIGKEFRIRRDEIARLLKGGDAK